MGGEDIAVDSIPENIKRALDAAGITASQPQIVTIPGPLVERLERRNRRGLSLSDHVISVIEESLNREDRKKR